jgi:cell wall-associated NlpC family hydrolase
MRSFRSNALTSGRGLTLSAVIAILLVILPNAQARTRHRKRSAFSVALEPFSLVHSVVHAVAAPIVHNAPRVALAAAVMPIKVAFYAPRRLRPRPPRSEQFYDPEEESSRPIRVAYRVSERTPAASAQADEDYDQDYEQEQGAREESTPQIETRGEHPTVAGSRAIVRNGVAYAPSRAPQSVKNAIWAANTIRRKPYIWGGGHGSFSDRGYDCSGSVSYALHGAGLLSAPLPSSDLMRYGERGRGRWITIYSRSGHTFAVIAGLRLDTTDLGHGGDVGPRWYADGRDTSSYVARHPAAL